MSSGVTKAQGQKKHEKIKHLKDQPHKGKKSYFDVKDKKQFKMKRKRADSAVSYSENLTEMKKVMEKNKKSRSTFSGISSKSAAAAADDDKDFDDDEEDNDGDDISDVGEDDKNDSDDEYVTVRQELTNMPFEDLIKLQQRLGTKVYKQVMGKSKEEDVKPLGKVTFKRENKNRPMEISSKKPYLKKVVTAKKKVNRDPRFDDLSGDYEEHHFKKSYKFLDDIKHREKEKLSKLIKKEKNKEKRINIQQLMNRINQQEISVKQQEKRKDIDKKWNKKEQKRVKEGKSPFYLKASDRKKLELADKYRELKKSGQLDKYLAKKKKKTAQKEKKKLPRQPKNLS